jgi:hypothetical protein
MEACDGLMSKSGYQLLRDVAGDGSRRRALLAVVVKAASELEIAHKVANKKEASRLMVACDGRMSKSGYQL